MTIAPQPLKWRSIALPVLLPTLLFSTGEGAIIPIIPLAADSLGASLAIAGLIAALLTLGELFGNIPSGWVISRVGERPGDDRRDGAVDDRDGRVPSRAETSSCWGSASCSPVSARRYSALRATLS